MDRHLKIYSKKGYLFAEISFNYDARKGAKANITEFNAYEVIDEESGAIQYSTYPLASRNDKYVRYQQFTSVADMKAHDINFCKTELYNRIENPGDYNFVYECDYPWRYFISMHRQEIIIGMAEINFNIDDNTKVMKFLSGKSFKWDCEITSNYLETNLDLIARANSWGDPDQQLNLSSYNITRVDSW